MKTITITLTLAIALMVTSAVAQNKDSFNSKEAINAIKEHGWYNSMDTTESVRLLCSYYTTESGTFKTDSGYIVMRMTYSKVDGKKFIQNTTGGFQFMGFIQYFDKNKLIHPIEIK